MNALIKAGADPEAKNDYGSTALRNATDALDNPQETTVEHIDTVIALIGEDSNPDANLYFGAWDDYGCPPLHVAARKGHTEIAIKLITMGTDLEAKKAEGELEVDDHGYTPLHLAAREGHTEIAVALIEAGANLEASDNYGGTPLHVSAREGHTEIVTALIKAGANIEGSQGSSDYIPLHAAAGEGHTDTAMTLIRAGANIETWSDPGYTALHYAARGGHTETAMALIEAGADPNSRISSIGSTPLHAAAIMGKPESTEGGRRVSVLKRQEGAPVLLG